MRGKQSFIDAFRDSISDGNVDLFQQLLGQPSPEKTQATIRTGMMYILALSFDIETEELFHPCFKPLLQYLHDNPDLQLYEQMFLHLPQKQMEEIASLVPKTEHSFRTLLNMERIRFSTLINDVAQTIEPFLLNNTEINILIEKTSFHPAFTRFATVNKQFFTFEHLSHSVFTCNTVAFDVIYNVVQPTAEQCADLLEKVLSMIELEKSIHPQLSYFCDNLLFKVDINHTASQHILQNIQQKKTPLDPLEQQIYLYLDAQYTQQKLTDMLETNTYIQANSSEKVKHRKI